MSGSIISRSAVQHPAQIVQLGVIASQLIIFLMMDL